MIKINFRIIENVLLYVYFPDLLQLNISKKNKVFLRKIMSNNEYYCLLYSVNII